MTSWGAHPFPLWHWLREDAPRGKGGPSHVYSTDGLERNQVAGFWGVACPERKGGAHACLVGRRWGRDWEAGLIGGEFFALEGGKGGEEAEGGEGGFYLVEDFGSIGAHQVKVIAISEGHER